MTTEYTLGPIPLTATVVTGGTATTVTTGPTAYGEEWEVQRYSVSLSEVAGVQCFGDCKVYRSHVSAGTLLDTTEDGHSATSENNSIKLRGGEKMLAQWTNCTIVGAVATITISGTRTVRGNRGY